MRVTKILLASAALIAPTAIYAQDEPAQAEVFVGPSVGYHDLGIDLGIGGIDDDGGFIYGAVAGVDVPVGESAFIGGEANYHFGTDLIDSEYGIAARAGVKLDGGAKLFLRGGYQEVDFDLGPFENAGFDDDDGDYLVGAGADFPLGDGPAQLRFGVDTIAFDTVRGTASVLFAF